MKLATLSSILGLAHVSAFSIPSSSRSSFIASTTKNTHAILRMQDGDGHNHSNDSIQQFDPFNTDQDFGFDWAHGDRGLTRSRSNGISDGSASALDAATPAALMSAAIMMAPSAADAVTGINTGQYNPDNFRPVCPASDGLYRFAQTTTQTIVGPDAFVEYGPLIAGGLLRVRLELCVVESFFNEAVGPFIEREGLKWILPLHETVETFLAGTIFAVASTFILVGSTKIISVLITYVDVFIGGPLRLFGGFFFDRSRGKPVTLDIGFGPFKTRIVGPGDPKEVPKEETLEELFDFKSYDTKKLPIVILSGSCKAVGEGSKVIREVFESLDLFIGRYLTLIATGYIGIKFLHFKIFPDFPF